MFSYIWNKRKTEINIPSYVSIRKVSGELPLLWGEHCVECAMPLCYTSCKMYVPRIDGRCLRFEDGVQPVIFDDHGIGAYIRIKKWGKLEAVLPKGIYGIPIERLKEMERILDYGGGLLEQFASLFKKWHQHRPSRVWETLFDRYLRTRHWRKQMPLDGFLMIVYNHQPSARRLHIEISNTFHDSVVLECGWNEIFYPISRFSLCPESDNRIKVYFDKAEAGELTFKTLNFVSLFSEKCEVPQPAEKIKCVAWDLDNTLWNGVIGDVGGDHVIIDKNAEQLIKELDRRGILQTIVSKNNFDIAWKKLQEGGLAKYFLYPAINWGRKSQSLMAIAKELNINIDTFAVIDDSKFERMEISQTLPQVRVYDAKEIYNLISLPEFDVPVTEESAKRRIAYQVDATRKTIKASWSGNYDEFLKDCKMQMSIYVPYSPEQKKRCLELLQRSNQYNISPDRRDASYLDSVITSEDHLSYAFEVTDRYGEYGIVGFACIKHSGNVYELSDFVMSCRIAQKKAERAFLNAVISRMPPSSDFKIVLHKTQRNVPLQMELKGMPFEKIEETDNYMNLIYHNTGHRFVDDDIYTVVF